MKKLLPAVALIAAFSTPLLAPLASAQNSDAKKPAAEYKSKAAKLNRAQVDEWLAKPDKVVFIDLRRPDELTTIGGLPVYLSIQSKELEKNLAYIPKDRSVITISNHAGRAGRSADLLIEKGYKVAGIVGVQDYEAEGGTLVKIAPPAPKADANKTAAAQ